MCPTVEVPHKRAACTSYACALLTCSMWSLKKSLRTVTQLDSIPVHPTQPNSTQLSLRTLCHGARRLARGRGRVRGRNAQRPLGIAVVGTQAVGGGHEEAQAKTAVLGKVVEDESAWTVRAPKETCSAFFEGSVAPSHRPRAGMPGDVLRASSMARKKGLDLKSSTLASDGERANASSSRHEQPTHGSGPTFDTIDQLPLTRQGLGAYGAAMRLKGCNKGLHLFALLLVGRGDQRVEALSAISQGGHLEHLRFDLCRGGYG